jgi:hypothetical protein
MDGTGQRTNGESTSDTAAGACIDAGREDSGKLPTIQLVCGNQSANISLVDRRDSRSVFRSRLESQPQNKERPR